MRILTGRSDSWRHLFFHLNLDHLLGRHKKRKRRLWFIVQFYVPWASVGHARVLGSAHDLELAYRSREWSALGE